MYEKELEEIVRSAGAMLIENIGTLQITKKEGPILSHKWT